MIELRIWILCVIVVVAYLVGVLAGKLTQEDRILKDCVGMKFFKDKQDPECVKKIVLFFDEKDFDNDIKEEMSKGEEDKDEEA